MVALLKYHTLKIGTWFTSTLYTAILFLAIVKSSWGQPEVSLDLHPGLVITQDQEVIRGRIKVFFDSNIVLCQADSITRTFTPIQLSFAQYYDETLGINREFTSILKAVNLPQPSFFELVIKGDLVLLSRTRWVDGISVVSEGNQVSFSSEGRNANDYYVYNHSEIRLLRSYRLDLFPFLRSKRTEVRKYIRQQNLSTGLLSDQIKIMEYYNSLSPE